VVGIDGGGNATVAWTASNVALYAVKQTTGKVDGAGAPPSDPDPTPTPTPTATATPAPTPAPTVTSVPPADTTVVASIKQASKLKLKRGAFTGPKVTCAEACKVAVTYKLKKTTVAKATFSLAAGQSKAPKLKAKRKGKLTGTVVVTDAAGNKRTFALKATLS